MAGDRIPVLYLAPWVDYGGTAKGTLDWFRWLDRERFAPSLIVTQHPSQNRLLHRVVPYAEEVWNLPELMPGGRMPFFISDFIHSRGIRVVHVMNSRLGFDMLPDLALLPRPPATVVQLHVEEDTRGGYVRYVTTRYGNLVDAFSVTSRHLAATIVEDYDISPSKAHVIYTGVDADEEFNPDAVEPVQGLESGPVHVLFLGRLVKQKDPHLMVRVADALRRRTEDFRIHVVGYGPDEAEVREMAHALDLERLVLFHGPTSEPAPWYAACDLVLLTSVFEGIPYVAFEAMAMGVPVVAPDLPGCVELLGDGGGRLVAPRDDIAEYVRALIELIRDPDLRRRLSRQGRERVGGELTLEHMGASHGDLYDALLARGRADERPGAVV